MSGSVSDGSQVDNRDYQISVLTTDIGFVGHPTARLHYNYKYPQNSW